MRAKIRSDAHTYKGQHRYRLQEVAFELLAVTIDSTQRADNNGRQRRQQLRFGQHKQVIGLLVKAKGRGPEAPPNQEVVSYSG